MHEHIHAQNSLIAFTSLFMNAKLDIQRDNEHSCFYNASYLLLQIPVALLSAEYMEALLFTSWYYVALIPATVTFTVLYNILIFRIFSFLLIVK